MPNRLLSTLSDILNNLVEWRVELKMRLSWGREAIKAVAMQIFNGEGALAPPRALRPPLLRDLFDASGKHCVFPEQHARHFTSSLHHGSCN